MVLEINRNRLLKVINTVFNEGIFGVKSYYVFDYHTSTISEKRMYINRLGLMNGAPGGESNPRPTGSESLGIVYFSVLG